MSCSCGRNFVNNKCMPGMPDNNSIFFGGLCDTENFVLTPNYWTEITVNGSIIVPEVKPSIEAIDSINARVDVIRKKVILTPVYHDPTTGTPVDVDNLEGKKTTGRKLILEGLICFTITYVSQNCDQQLNSFHGQIPFSAFIVLPKETNLEANFDVAACLEDITVKNFNDRAVTLCSTLVLQANPAARVCDTPFADDSGILCGAHSAGEGACVCANEPLIKGICSEEKINSILANANNADPDTIIWTEIFIPEILNIPNCKPDIEQILSLTSKVDIICQKVIKTPKTASGVENYEGLKLTGRKLIVEAILRQRVTYVSATECQSVHSAHFDVPLSLFIVVPQDTEVTDKFRLTTCIEDIFVCALNPRQIFKNTTLFIKADKTIC